MIKGAIRRIGFIVFTNMKLVMCVFRNQFTGADAVTIQTNSK